MLQAATAAGGDMDATRLGSLGRAGDEFGNFRFVVIAVPLAHAQAHRFAGKRTSDEDGFAVDTGNATAIVADVDDGGLELGHCFFNTGPGIWKNQRPEG
jgi:hypothetical protein